MPSLLVRCARKPPAAARHHTSRSPSLRGRGLQHAGTARNGIRLAAYAWPPPLHISTPSRGWPGCSHLPGSPVTHQAGTVSLRGSRKECSLRLPTPCIHSTILQKNPPPDRRSTHHHSCCICVEPSRLVPTFSWPCQIGKIDLTSQVFIQIFHRSTRT